MGPKEIKKENVGDAYQAETKYVRGELPHRGIDLLKRPPQFKIYDHAANRVDLPQPEKADGEGIWGVLQARRTRRTYKPEPLTLMQLSQLLWAGDGKTKEGRETFLRSAPSAGALYPIEIYVMANNVEGLEKGIYHFDVENARLSFILPGDFGEAAAHAALDQPMLAKSGAVIFMTAVVERTRWKYDQRAYRYIYLDAGHIGQNLCLAAQGLGLGACEIGAFYDDELNGILKVDGVEETVVYAITVGR
jgi:SagB-type dehydrogenase family enzyme